QAPCAYTVYVHNSFGCFSPATVYVTVNPQPFTPTIPVVSGIINVCPYLGSGDQITYTATTTTGSGTNTWTWILPPNVNLIAGGGTNSPNNFVTITFNAA